MPVTNYIWDVETDSYLMETDGSNVTQAVYTNEPVHFGRLISQRRSSATSYLHADALGSTRQLTGAAKTTTDSWLYDAWGVEKVHSGSTILPFTWIGAIGYIYDSELGVFYVRRRTYGPMTSQWLTIDPMWYVGGPNLYRYASNQPNDGLDPSGLQIVWDIYQPVSDLLPPSIEQPQIRPFDPSELPTLEPCVNLAEFLCFTAESWSRDLCNKRPPCSCADSKNGRKRVTDEQYKQMFEEFKTQLGVTCAVTLVTKAECVSGLANFAVTCPTGTSKKPSSVICLPTTLEYCQARALVIHEMTHALQICGNSSKSRDVREGEAYRRQCEDLQDQKCLTETPAARAKAIAGCVKKYKNGSTNKSNVDKFDKACRDLTQQKQ